MGLTILLLASGAACSRVDDPSLVPSDDARLAEAPPELPERGREPQRQLLWGDLHIHSSYSYDAYTMGVRALPDDAYTYAKGGTIQHGAGYRIRARRPLDFAAVTDHAEFLGQARHRGASEGNPSLLPDILATGIPWRITWHFFKTTFFEFGTDGESRRANFGGGPSEVEVDAWREIVAAAEGHDAPGRFTTFVAYEWSSMPNEDNLHRNVIYRSSRVPEVPFSSLDSQNPEDLWQALDAQREQGMDVLAIPHNANVSNGRMYERTRFDGSPLTEQYVEDRMRNEPVSEILQVKGSSETHPILSTEDELAGFEIFDQRMKASGGLSEPRGSYARDALRTGLEVGAELGGNPYRFGFIGSSDSHNASSSVEEDNYHGKLPLLDGTAGQRIGQTLLLPNSQNRGLNWSAAGLAAVWAKENTRASIFDALRRKETYATSGPRIRVRFFGGWDLEGSLPDEANAVEQADAAGVPMGGTLRPPSRPNAAPSFFVLALKDPIGANLDRVQIVKGWLAADGTSRERIYDVAASDGRAPDPQTHRAPPLGSTVDVARAAYTNDIGATSLSAVWTDPYFERDQAAFYYARVIEIPTPRWSTYDAAAMGVAAPEPAAIQERAITSAIWYDRPRP